MQKDVKDHGLSQLDQLLVEEVHPLEVQGEQELVLREVEVEVGLVY